MKAEGRTIGELTEARVEQRGPAGRGEFTYVDISSIDRETKRIIDPKVLPTAKAPSRAKQVLKAGDILVSMTRPNLNAVAVVPPDLDGSIGSTGFHVLRGKEAEPGFLFYAVQTPGFVDAMCQKVQGALYPAVRPRDISSFLLFPCRTSGGLWLRLRSNSRGWRREWRRCGGCRPTSNATAPPSSKGQLVPTEAGLVRELARAADGHPGGVREISRGSSEANTSFSSTASPRRKSRGRRSSGFTTCARTCISRSRKTR